MNSRLWLLFAGAALLGASACNRAQEKAPGSGTPAQQSKPVAGAVDWRQRMQANHNADSSVEQQTRRLTQELSLTSQQQTKVRALSWWHNQQIQAILDTAPPTLSYQDFRTQVHAISAQYHDSVNAILTPRQLDLMKTLVGQGRRPPPA
jgi:hypothetical protein